MKLKNIIILSLSAIFMTSCSLFVAQKPPPKPIKKVLIPKRTPGDVLQKAPKYINWQGYYHGKLPCSDCQGVDTWLELKQKDGRAVYDLREKFLGQKNVSVYGGIGWLREGTVAQLFDLEDRYLFLGNGTVTFIDSPFSLAKDSYSLEKLDVFENENATLLVSPLSIQAGKMGGKWAIKFIALTNLENLTPDGYKSLRSTYLLKCDSGDFQMSRIAYYERKFTQGKFVYPKENLSGHWFNVKGIKIMESLKEKYCHR